MNATSRDGENGYGWVVSLLFWPCLLASGAMFAAVALAPKAAAHLELRREFYERQVELVRLEQETLYLEKVADALEHDPQFAAEQARVDLDAGRPGEERIPVDPALHLEARVRDELGDVPEFRPPWYSVPLDVAAKDSRTRRNLLLAAGGLIVLAFALLHEGQTPHLFATMRSVGHGARRIWGGVKWAASRYHRPHVVARAGSAECAFRPSVGVRKAPKFLKQPTSEHATRV